MFTARDREGAKWSQRVQQEGPHCLSPIQPNKMVSPTLSPSMAMQAAKYQSLLSQKARQPLLTVLHEVFQASATTCIL